MHGNYRRTSTQDDLAAGLGAFLLATIVAIILLWTTGSGRAQTYFPAPANADAGGSNLNPGGNQPHNYGSNAYGAPGNGPMSANPNSSVISGAGTPSSNGNNANTNALSLSRKR